MTPSVGDSDVTLGIDVKQPGTPQHPWVGGTDDTDTGTGPAPDVCATPASNNSCPGAGVFRDPFTITMVPPATQPITLADIASFRPTTGISGMEPNGWMIVGLDTNFYSTATTQVVDGALLGQPASVRFTPVGWRWSYGDGAAATLRTPGAPWAALGVAEFSATSGSHVYRAPGTYVIDLTVIYEAEYRFGAGGWTQISGTLGLPSNRLTATAGSASTVLVERECTVNPHGPGC
ncbi:hypothetical protein QMG83_04765 [Salinibacterium sp. G-O1]|uniref:hypothetical protein n=1 Tax=Salinibacterium sp. G-O1 TaxID=3046208 RepID=UPI0024BBCADC|nr:hypothetical protein [Salinibacterium sp. G-O1]MDJ0334529.1 hypothetical protein [Salinibacterium sp. G-O1]